MRWDRSALIGGATGGIGDGYGHGWGGVGGVTLFTLSKKRSKEAFERANFFCDGIVRNKSSCKINPVGQN